MPYSSPTSGSDSSTSVRFELWESGDLADATPAVLDWLQNVTFPREKRFSDEAYATKTFESVVHRLISLGTTTCAYYSSIHLEASKILANICYEKGQRAFVGKCNVRDAHPATRPCY